jgi:hypothetical protein
MYERERLPKRKENSILIKLKEEINGIIEEILEHGQSDITDMNICCIHNYDKNESAKQKKSKLKKLKFLGKKNADLD